MSTRDALGSGSDAGMMVDAGRPSRREISRKGRCEREYTPATVVWWRFCGGSSWQITAEAHFVNMPLCAVCALLALYAPWAC
mmetsp:Transcript_18186/g.57563  ORF Transcript_18186/g.57563 Transcript_18186/m.57563 type:complete len:82 (+) Transcript_18186:352-597(+)|eukprot:scaffold8148_cov241-Isochrysis_galbana.AAC.2